MHNVTMFPRTLGGLIRRLKERYSCGRGTGDRGFLGGTLKVVLALEEKWDSESVEEGKLVPVSLSVEPNHSVMEERVQND